jgi:hypothetical protein
MRIRVVNFFSISEYAPHAPSGRVWTVSSLRGLEDRRVLSAIDPRIRIESFDLLDAPLRFCVNSDAICRPETIALQTDRELAALASRIRKYFTRGFVLAPLGLGDHVDHLAVQKAAIENSHSHRLGFYEDLPYAIWTSEASLCDKVRNAEQTSQIGLKPAVIRDHNNAVSYKFHLVRRYCSQVTRKEASDIASYAKRYGGERIWIPRSCNRWRSLTQPAQ